MARYAMIWKIRPELKEDYKKDHTNIWPEMAEALKDSGYKNYSIYAKNYRRIKRADKMIFTTITQLSSLNLNLINIE